MARRRRRRRWTMGEIREDAWHRWLRTWPELAVRWADCEYVAAWQRLDPEAAARWAARAREAEEVSR